MLRILFAFIIAFFIPAGNSSDHHNIVPEVDDLNTEQVRQIAICMLQFYKESLEKVTVSLQKDPIVYAFFEHKKGKKYKVQNGQCSLEKLNRFSSHLHDDIYDLTTLKNDLIITNAQFTSGNITETQFDEFLALYGIEDRKKISPSLYFYSKKIEKLESVKIHVDGLIATKVPKAITTKRAWKYFKSHRPNYFDDLSPEGMHDFKPKFLVHLRGHYGFG